MIGYVLSGAQPSSCSTGGTDELLPSVVHDPGTPYDFEVDRASIVIAALKGLADDGEIDMSIVRKASQQYGKTARALGAPWQR